MKQFVKFLFGTLLVFFSTVQAISLEDLYTQYDNVVVARVAHVKSVKIALYPNKGDILAGQIILPDKIIINKIELQLKNSQGDVFWESVNTLSFSGESNKNLPFKYNLKKNLPKNEKLTLSVKLFQDAELVAIGSSPYENKGVQTDNLIDISETKVVVNGNKINVLAIVPDENIIEGDVFLKAVILDSKKQILINSVSKIKKLDKNQETEFSLELDAPINPGNYLAEISLQNDSKKTVSAVKKQTFLMDGTFASIRKMVFSQPEDFFDKGDTVEISSEGFVNKNISSLNVVIQIDSPEGVELFADDFQVPVNRFKEFSFNKQFVLPVYSSQLLGVFKVYNEGELLVSENFDSQVYEKKIEKEVVTETTNLVEEPEVAPFAINWVFVLGGSLILLIIFIVLFFLLRKNKNSVKNLLLIFGASFVFFSTTQASINNICDPEAAVLADTNLHCQLFDEEVYNGNANLPGEIAGFGKIPLVSTAIAIEGGIGVLETERVYNIDIGVCTDEKIVNGQKVSNDCASEDANFVYFKNVANFTASATNWFQTEIEANKLLVTQDFKDSAGDDEVLIIVEAGLKNTFTKKIKVISVWYEENDKTTSKTFVYSNPYELTIDNQAPEVSFDRKVDGNTLLENPNVENFYNKGTESGQVEVAKNFTNKEIKVEVICNDNFGSNPDGAGCLKANDTIASKNYELLVTGNFCANQNGETICNTSGTRNFEICDKVGNCATKELVLKNYDGSAPSSGDDAQLINEAAEFSVPTGGSPIKAFENFLFSLKGVSDVPAEVSGFDAHACGLALADADDNEDDIGDGIVNYSNSCRETTKWCAPSAFFRGKKVYSTDSDPSNYGECNSPCPSNFIRVDADTAKKVEDGGAQDTDRCLPQELLCQYRFPFCFPIEW